MLSSSYQLSRYWCHSCHHSFFLDPTAGSFLCVTCHSELIEELNGATEADDPRLFVAERSNESSRREGFRVVYVVRRLVDLEGVGSRRYAAIWNFINGHAEGYTGIRPASQAQIESLQTPIASQIADSDCPICQETLKSEDAPTRMPCGHTYHRACLTRWLELHNSCPVCRAPISSGHATSPASNCHS